MNGNDFMERYSVRFDWSAEGYQRDADGWEHQRFSVSFAYDAKDGGTPVYATTYCQGLGIDHEPQAGDVLESVALDISSADQSFEDWAADYGYDSDSRKAEAIYNACATARKNVYDWCESQAMFEDFESITEGDES